MADSGGGECAAGGKKTGKKPAKAQPSEVIPSEKTGVDKSLSIEKSSSGPRDCEVTLKMDKILETMTALSGRLSDLEKVGKLNATPVASTSRGTESHGTESSSAQESQADGEDGASVRFAHEQFENEFDSAEDTDVASDNDFDAGIVVDTVGEGIHPSLADRFEEGLLLPSDRARVRDTLQNYPRPKNVTSLRTPTLNRELDGKLLDKFAKKRDSNLSFVQEQVGCALKIIAQLMSDLKEKPASRKLSERDSFSKLADAARLLMASHKDLSQVRREALRPTLSQDCRALCNAQLNFKLTSNEFLFGEDLAKRVDDAVKNRKLSSTLSQPLSKNATRGRQFYQGRPRQQFQQRQQYQQRRGVSNRQTGHKFSPKFHSQQSGIPSKKTKRD